MKVFLNKNVIISNQITNTITYRCYSIHQNNISLFEVAIALCITATTKLMEYMEALTRHSNRLSVRTRGCMMYRTQARNNWLGENMDGRFAFHKKAVSLLEIIRDQ